MRMIARVVLESRFYGRFVLSRVHVPLVSAVMPIKFSRSCWLLPLRAVTYAATYPVVRDDALDSLVTVLP